MARERPADSLRTIEVNTRFLEQHPATVLYSSGMTRVLCAATLEQGVPAFLDGTSKGWATAEYDLLPASTGSRHSAIPRPKISRTRSRRSSQEGDRKIVRPPSSRVKAISGWARA